MSKRLQQLKAERSNVRGTLFVARCAISLLTMLLIVQFVFEKPITPALMVFSVVMVPLALFCYDKLVGKFKDGQR